MTRTLEVRIRTIAWTATVALLSIAATLIVTSAWSADAAPGDLDSTYVPTAGCRVFDYRPAPNQVGQRSTPLGPGEVATQQITGGVGDCVGALSIPSDAVGVAMNVTAIAPTAQTNLRLFPANLTEVPTLSNLNVSAGQAPFPNKVDVALSPGGAVKLFNQNGQVSVLADVVGYYTTSSLIEIDSRLAALEASDVTQDDVIAAIAAETDSRLAALEATDAIQDNAITATAADVDALHAAQPFVKVSETVSGGAKFGSIDVGTLTPTEIRSVTVTAPVNGQVTTIATGDMAGGSDEDLVECAIMPSVTAPTEGERVFTQMPDSSNLSVSRVFDIAAGETATYYLVCQSSGGTSAVGSPRLTAIFTPAL